MNPRRQEAFTLIEVLVALGIFGVMSMLAYVTIGSALDNSVYLGERTDRLQSVQRTMRYLSSDLLQATPRPIRSELGDSYDAAFKSDLGAEFALEFTRGGWGNPAGLPRGTMQRVAYRIEEDELLRYHWGVLDRTYANEPVVTVLLDDVESLYLRFYSANGEPSEVWPPVAQQGGQGIRLLPRAVEIVLTLPDEGELTRLIEMAP